MKLFRIQYLKHYIGRECIVFDPKNLKSGTIEQIDIEDNSVYVNTGVTSHWVDAEYVKPNCKQFVDLDGHDLMIIIDNIVVNGVRLKYSDFEIKQRTSVFIQLQCDKFHIIIRDNWGMFCTGVDGSVASAIDNTAAIIFLLCELNYDVAGFFN